MRATTLTSLYVGEDYIDAPETSADIEAKVFRNQPITTTQRDALASPQAGWMIYNSTTDIFEFYNGTVWGAV